MQLGKVKWYDPRKGFGFITPNDGSADVFVHVESIHESKLFRLQENQPIGYDTKKDGDRICAVNLVLRSF